MNEAARKFRVFAALKSPREWDEQIGGFQQRLKPRLPEARWSNSDQTHITLRFFGYIMKEQVEQLKTIFGEVAPQHPSFQLNAGALGCFPNTQRPRVFWVGLTGGAPHLEDLHRGVLEATRAIGQPPEDREFKAHLTLARFERPTRSTVEQMKWVLDQNNPLETLTPWDVREVLLMQSHLSPKGAVYETIQSFALKHSE